MPTAERNRSWGLDAFLDSLVRDLDDWQETLAVKGITRPLTYTVQGRRARAAVLPAVRR
jgi:hypothetical protein